MMIDAMTLLNQREQKKVNFVLNIYLDTTLLIPEC